MNNLEKYLHKKVKIIDDNGKSWLGKVNSFCSAIDNDEEYDSITLETAQQPNGLVEFAEDEIKSIEITK